MTDPSDLTSALSNLLNAEQDQQRTEAVSLAAALANLDDEQTSTACAAITKHLEQSLAGDETQSSRREGLERWARALQALYESLRGSSSNAALIDYLAQARMTLLVDHLGWYAESASWLASVSEDVRPQVRQVLEGDAAGAALHLNQPEKAERLLDQAILGAATLRDVSSLARHYGTLAIALARREDFVSALRSIEVALTFDAVANDDDSRRLKLRSDQAIIAAAVLEDEEIEG